MLSARVAVVIGMLAGTLFVDIARAAPTVSNADTSDKSWQRWLERKLLSDDEAKSMLRGFVEEQLRPLPLPKTREEWQQRRGALRQEILTLLGIDDLVPAKWDLHLANQGTLHCEGYRIEKITFESYPGLAISAVMYIPDGIEGRVPGIVSISGHHRVSKAADYVQQRNVNLALRGCVVLAYDYYGYGDRKTGDDPARPTGANSHGIRTFSHTRRSATSLEVLDAIRAIDALFTRPEVDADRIGFTGESGGGNSTYWIAALDPRVKLAVPVSSVTSFDYWIRTDANWDWHQRPPGIRRIADIGTLLALHAPNPLVVVSSKRRTDDEEFPVEEAEKSYQWAKHVYGLFGVEEAAVHYESTTAHGYQEDKREQLYVAVERWLSPPRPFNGKELPAAIEKEDDLRCRLPANNLTVRDVYQAWLKPLPRATEVSDPNALCTALRQRLGWPAELPAVKAEQVGHEHDETLEAEFWIIESEPGIRLPAVYIHASRAAGAITLVPGRDRTAVARALDAGRSVLAFDPRGIGTPRQEKATESYWPRMVGAPSPELLSNVDGSVFNWAWFAGRPWSGQWALDLAQAARFARARLLATSVSVEAENAYGWMALLAGAAAPDLFDSGSVTIPHASLLDDIRQREDSSLADVPGLLESMDIPQLRALWPAGRVTVIQHE